MNKDQGTDWSFQSPASSAGSSGFSEEYSWNESPSPVNGSKTDPSGIGYSDPAVQGETNSFDSFYQLPSGAGPQKRSGRGWIIGLICAVAVLLGVGLILLLAGGGSSPASPPVGVKDTATPVSVPTTTPGLAETTAPSPLPTATPTTRPTATHRPTSTPQPTATPTPHSTATHRPTGTPRPTATPTPRPTATPTPRPTATHRPTSTPRPTATPAPTEIPAGQGIRPKMPSANFEDSWYDVSMRYYYQQLTAREKEMFRAIYQSAMDYAPVTLQVSHAYTDEETQRVFFSLWYDCPELFQFESYQTSYQQNGAGEYTYTFTPSNPYITREEYLRRSERIRQAMQAINQAMPQNADDYETELACYRYLAEHCEYLIDEPNTTTAYSSIVYGYSQCDGYSKGLNLLLRCAGIPCLYVMSDNHSWNIVRINGAWYQCDATWDDPLGNANVFLEGQDDCLPHLNIPDRLMLRLDSHAYSLPEGFTVPVCTEIRDSYTCRDGIYISSGTPHAKERLEEAIRTAYAAGKRKMLIRADGDREYSVLEQCASGIYSIMPDLRHFKSYSEMPELYCIYFEFE